jgi:undecaprenyl-diphosphatase UppP
MILASAAMNIGENEFVKTFEIAIQLGAILAIALMYIKRFMQGIDIYLKLMAAFLPTAVVGLLAYKYIKALLFNPTVVSISLIVGGIILILIDKRVVNTKSKTENLADISYKNAFYIGLMQCLSMIPGTSRAAATIVGGVFNGLDKKQATEFSFLLAVPTMFAAYDGRLGLRSTQNPNKVHQSRTHVIRYRIRNCLRNRMVCREDLPKNRRTLWLHPFRNLPHCLRSYLPNFHQELLKTQALRP